MQYAVSYADGRKEYGSEDRGQKEGYGQGAVSYAEVREQGGAESPRRRSTLRSTR